MTGLCCSNVDVCWGEARATIARASYAIAMCDVAVVGSGDAAT